MKQLLIFLLSSIIIFHAKAQFVAKMEIKEPIKGLCSPNDVYVLFPTFKGQAPAECPVPDNEILRRLDSAVIYLKANPETEDKGMVNIIVNCKGEVVKCEMDNKTKSLQLDEQIVAVFSGLGIWKPGKLNKKPVDSSRLWSFEIKQGKLLLK